jgi:hypothetical protein
VKKLFLIFLLALLPLQYSWAAGAAYCQHEQGRVTHFGHHGHRHQAKGDDAKGQDKASAVHNDCNICQFSCQAPFLQTQPNLNVLALKAYPQAPPFFYFSHIPAGPIRPDRALVA